MMDILPDTDIPGMLGKVKEVTVSGITVSVCAPGKQWNWLTAWTVAAAAAYPHGPMLEASTCAIDIIMCN
jgi:hypothetical protein